MSLTSLQILTTVCNIFESEMDLAADQVYVFNQKINFPPDSRIYIAVGLVSAKPFGSRNVSVSTSGGLEEQQSVNMLANLSINILSKGTEALMRKEEVILALKSTYSRSQQEKYGFGIASISNSFVNLSPLEGTSILNRFNIGVNIQYNVSKNKQIAYYDDFSDAVTTEE